MYVVFPWLVLIGSGNNPSLTREFERHVMTENHSVAAVDKSLDEMSGLFVTLT